MNTVIKDLLLVQSFDLNHLIDEYRLFLTSILPSIFILAIVVEFFDRLDPIALGRRTLISILILVSVTSFYHSAISLSMEAADEVLQRQKQGNILLMDMFEGTKLRQKISKPPEDFFKNDDYVSGSISFIKYHLFDSFINDSFTVTIYFIANLCFLILKVVYSLVYYLGYGLVGIPCLLYLFPTMGNVLRGAVLSFLWCLVTPHVLVFILSIIGSEINKGYSSGQIIGGSMIGTSLLFILTLFIAFTPLITAMILNGSGISQAGGIIATIGANYVMNLPRNTFNNMASVLGGSPLSTIGPKTRLATNTARSSYRMAKSAKNIIFKPESTNYSESKESSVQTQTRSNSGSRSNSKHNEYSSNYFNNSTTESKNSNGYSNHNTNRNKKTVLKHKGGKSNGTVSKYHRVNSKTKKANDIYCNNRRISTNNITSHRPNFGKNKERS